MEALARNAVQSAQLVDINLEKIKISCPLSPTDQMKKEVEELEAALSEKESLLQKSLDQVIGWDMVLTRFRNAQGSILIPPKSSN